VVFNEGSIYCCFHSSFRQSFLQAADQWSEGMRMAGNLAHQHNFPRNYVPSDRLDDIELDRADEESDNSSRAQLSSRVRRVLSAPQAHHTRDLHRQIHRVSQTAHGTGLGLDNGSNSPTQLNPPDKPSANWSASTVSDQTSTYDDSSGASALLDETPSSSKPNPPGRTSRFSIFGGLF
jgi:hypothetical protein